MALTSELTRHLAVGQNRMLFIAALFVWCILISQAVPIADLKDSTTLASLRRTDFSKESVTTALNSENLPDETVTPTKTTSKPTYHRNSVGRGFSNHGPYGFRGFAPEKENDSPSKKQQSK